MTQVYQNIAQESGNPQPTSNINFLTTYIWHESAKESRQRSEIINRLPIGESMSAV